jgi:hypothetical protein
VLRKALTASALAVLLAWQGAAAPDGGERKAKWAERAETGRAQAPAGDAALSTEKAPALTPLPGGKAKEWIQERWEVEDKKDWDREKENTYWDRTGAIDMDFMPPYVGAAYSWASRREIPLSSASRFAVSSADGKTCILFGGAGAGEYAGSGVVYYAEDREGASWKVSPVKESGGFYARDILDLCWTPKLSSGYICAATRITRAGTPKTPLFYYDGPVPTSNWVSATEYASVPPRTVYAFSAVAPGPKGASAEVYLGYSGLSVGTAQVYYYNEPRWNSLGKLSNAKDVHALCATDKGVLAGTGPRGIVYEWTGSKWNSRQVTGLSGGDINDVVKIGNHYYAAAGNCSPGGKARLFRTKDLVQWQDVTPRATGVESLAEFVAVAEFGKDGAVAAVGDDFEHFYVSQNPAPANWGVVAGDADAAGKDVVHVSEGSDFWGDFFGYEKDSRVYARKFRGFKTGGVLYSSVYDSYDKLIKYETLEVAGAMASGDATFWLRAAADIAEFETPQGGPGEPKWVKVTPGETLPAELNNKRYIQYKIRLDVTDGRKFPPVVKRVRLAMDSTYAKVTATSPANGSKGHNVDVAIRFIFTKKIDTKTIIPENITLTGKQRSYEWLDVYEIKGTTDFIVLHEPFEPYDEITVKLESVPRREILDADGWEIDPDGDGQPGGEYKFTFGVGAGGGGDKEGPNVYDVTVQPNPTFGAKDVLIKAIADDAETGNSPIAAAEYSFGDSPAPAGEGQPMEGDFGVAKVEVRAVADISELSKGQKRIMVYVRALDMAGNWGDPTAAAIFIRPPDFLPAEYVYFFPNPCRDDEGYFHYLVTKDSEITVRVYDIRGRLVEEISATAQAYTGERGLRWDVSRVGADVYIFQFTARATTGEVATVTKKLAVLK